MKSWPELIGSGNPENGDYLAGYREQIREVSEMTMIERVAQAIDRVLGSDHESLSMEMGCGNIAKDLRKEAMLDASHAAIAAMREPTPEILRVMAAPFVATGRAVTVSEYWRSLIDAALKE